jgi:hypothetical protein
MLSGWNLIWGIFTSNSIRNCTFGSVSVAEKVKRSGHKEGGAQYLDERIDEQGVLEWRVFAVIFRIRIDERLECVRNLQFIAK